MAFFGQRKREGPNHGSDTGKKTDFLSHLYNKIFLPRQARDKHGENSKKARFLEAWAGLSVLFAGAEDAFSEPFVY
jgi:hypothetical protein